MTETSEVKKRLLDEISKSGSCVSSNSHIEETFKSPDLLEQVAVVSMRKFLTWLFTLAENNKV